MNILAIDCCLKITGAAVMIENNLTDGKPPFSFDGKPPFSFDFEQKDLGRRQSSELPRMVERLLEKNNLEWRNIDYVALTNGPGYFTGIRVGAAYASGLAYACNAKIVPVSSLEMLSYTFRKNNLNKKILTLIYAGHGFVYASCENFLETGEYSHENIKSWLEKNPDCEIISDDPERAMPDLKINQVKPDIISLCEIAYKNIICTKVKNPLELKISYYRAPQGVN